MQYKTNCVKICESNVLCQKTFSASKTHFEHLASGTKSTLNTSGAMLTSKYIRHTYFQASQALQLPVNITWHCKIPFMLSATEMSCI